MSPVSVFISSTCYDLLDLRSEVIRFLEQHSFLVRASDDYETMFEVHGKIDSISTCLLNVEKSDVVVFFIDRRYGPLTGIAPYERVSATHAEIKHAMVHRKPIFTFVRDQSIMESEHVLRNSTFAPKWLDSKAKAELSNLISERKRLAEAAANGRSNWFDPFKNSFELRPLVLKRLLTEFPEHVGAFARKPEKIVRLYFAPTHNTSEGDIKGTLINAGNGPALDLKVGWSADGQEHILHHQGALLVGEHMPEGAKGVFSFRCPKRVNPSQAGALVFCEYQNASGDHYRLVVEHAWGEGHYTRKDPEQFYAKVGEEWLRIN